MGGLCVYLSIYCMPICVSIHLPIYLSHLSLSLSLSLSLYTHTQTHTYIYIYIPVCVYMKMLIMHIFLSRCCAYTKYRDRRMYVLLLPLVYVYLCTSLKRLPKLATAPDTEIKGSGIGLARSLSGSSSLTFGTLNPKA